MTARFDREILKAAFAAGHTVSIDDGDGVLVPYGNLTRAMNAINAVDCCDVFIFVGDVREWMTIVNGNAPEEAVSDFRTGGFIEREWEKLFAALEA